MTKNRRAWFPWLLAGALSIGGPLSALPPGGDFGPGGPAGEGREERMERRMDRLQERLGLAPEQKQRLQEHRQAHRQQALELRQEMEQKRAALKAELEKPDFKEADARALHGQLKEIHGRMADHRLNGILEVREILTPEQFRKFHELGRQQWKARGMRRGGGSFRGPRGADRP